MTNCFDVTEVWFESEPSEKVFETFIDPKTNKEMIVISLQWEAQVRTDGVWIMKFMEKDAFFKRHTFYPDSTMTVEQVERSARELYNSLGGTPI